MVPNRKRSFPNSQVYCFHPGTPPTSSTEDEGQKSASAGEEIGMPVRKRMRTESSESSAQQDQNSGSFRESSTEGRQVQSAPAAVHFSTVSCRDSHDSIVDLTRDSEFISSAIESHDSIVDLTSDAEFISSAIESHDSIVDLTSDDDILSRYQMGRLLGQGGFGAVYEGTRLEDGLKVAVKITKKMFNIKYISIPGHPQPLPLEVGLSILANTEPKVPEIIQLLDWQDQPERYIMILERPSPCQDLFDYMESHGHTVHEDIARFFLVQILKAAEVCCERGVFHRDIKPENLLINRDTYQVKLIDFGCGDILRECGYETFAGTQAYCPPEYHTRGKYHGKPATVWSLGVLLYRLVCGKFPHWSDLRLMDDGDWCRPDLSKECCDLIRGLLRSSPTHRMDLRDIIYHKWFMGTE